MKTLVFVSVNRQGRVSHRFGAEARARLTAFGMA